jgi:CxxC motif-containing protein (DUF1111 family)
MSLGNRYSCVLKGLLLVSAVGASAQTDPGVAAASSGGARAGGPLPGLSPEEMNYFTEGLRRFSEIDSVTGTEPNAPGSGLGPRFNLNSCAGCHAQPAVGGTSPAANPQLAVATQFGANNAIPAFITANGPVREARFRLNSNGSRDGGVHDLFVITGRADAAGCNIKQPDFAGAASSNNLSLRIPTPLFGAGLIEAIPDSVILANKSANASPKRSLGIGGHENRNGNDGTITRFGWKAQNKSLTLFCGEAYNVEQGVTNDIFQNERDETPGCVLNGIPEDHANFAAADGMTGMSDLSGFAVFGRFLAPPAPGPATQSAQNGARLFSVVGCAFCHTQSLTTGLSSSAALSNKTANLFSDLLVHNMGSGLADQIVQGSAGPAEFRTAPLWGVGQRIFFLHDGRANDLVTAIQAHSSSGSEANAVIGAFNRLSTSQKQNIVDFLRSL